MAWMVVEAGVAIAAGIAAASIALVAFGLDSVIELFSAAIVVWQLRSEGEDREIRAVRLIGVTFFALAAGDDLDHPGARQGVDAGVFGAVGVRGRGERAVTEGPPVTPVLHGDEHREQCRTGVGEQVLVAHRTPLVQGAPQDALGGNFLHTPRESAELAFRTSAFSLKSFCSSSAL